MLAVFEVGSFIRFLYPRHNYRGVRSRLEQRRFKVEQIRYTDVEPIESETIELDPLLDRGAVLLTGIDLDKNSERSFYLHSMAQIEVIGQPTFGGEVEPPKLFAVAELSSGKVVARCMPQEQAEGFAQSWARHGNMACTITESINLPSDDQVSQQLL